MSARAAGRAPANPRVEGVASLTYGTFSKNSMRSTMPAGVLPATGGEDHTEQQERAGRDSSGFEVTDRGRPQQKEALSMAVRHHRCNDHDRRLAAIVRLAARIGMDLRRDESRPLSEGEWTKLARLQLQLRELRIGAGL